MQNPISLNSKAVYQPAIHANSACSGTWSMLLRSSEQMSAKLMVCWDARVSVTKMRMGHTNDFEARKDTDEV